MGYRIVYGNDTAIKQKGRFWDGKMRLMTAVFFLLFLLSVKLVWDEGAEDFRSGMLHGEAGLAVDAVGKLVTSLGDGVPLKDAVTAFCRQVIAGAQVG